MGARDDGPRVPEIKGPPTVDAATGWEVDQLLARYVHAIDNGAWDELDAVFTPDAEFVTLRGTVQGIDRIRDYIAAVVDLPAHHIVNTVLRPGPGGSVHAWSRLITVGFDAGAGTGDYTDLFVPTGDGLRIARRRVRMRNRADEAPDGSPWPTATFAVWEADRADAEGRLRG